MATNTAYLRHRTGIETETTGLAGLDTPDVNE